GHRVGQLAPPPVFQAVNPPASGGDHRAVPLDHRGHLLALIGVHDEDHFIVTHCRCSSWTWLRRPGLGRSPTASRSATGEARNWKLYRDSRGKTRIYRRRSLPQRLRPAVVALSVPAISSAALRWSLGRRLNSLTRA